MQLRPYVVAHCLFGQNARKHTKIVVELVIDSHGTGVAL